MIEKEIRVAVIDDEASIRESLRHWCNWQTGFQCVGAWQTVPDALAAIPWIQPQVLLLDLHLADSESVESIPALKSKVPDMAVMMLTGEDDYYWVEQALHRGADGYLTKKNATDLLARAIRDVLLGGSPLTPDVSRKLITAHINASPDSARLDQLSPRERMVIAKLAEGMVYKEIAEHFGISIETVRTHSRRIFKKLNVGTKTEAVLKYLKSIRPNGAPPGC